MHRHSTPPFSAALVSPAAVPILLLVAAALVPAAPSVARAQATRTEAAVREGAGPVAEASYRDMRWRLVGPFRAGWATVATGIPGSATTFYVGTAGGGVWKTDDAGRTWRGLMQDAPSQSIGGLAVAPSDPSVLYAGTGQVAARYDIMAGDGVYRSDDGGETWRNVGLRDSRHVGKILVDPNDADVVLVAALGHVFGPNVERGVYRSTDGGGTWKQALKVDDRTGAVDLARDGTAPQTVYAATWQMTMHPWLDYFQPRVGPGSGVWKSTDGGTTWKRLTGGGFPSGDLGRIGVGVARGTGGRVVYAVVEATTDAAGIWRSGDGGGSWTHVSDRAELASDYFGRLTVSPTDPNTVFLMGQSIRISTDGGRTWEPWNGSPGGDDWHDFWIDPLAPERMVAGVDQGATVSVNGGRTWSSWYNQPTGQFYHLGADDRFPYHIYSGQQDNGTVEIASRGPYGVIELRDWHPVGGDERDDMVPKPGVPDTVFGSGLGGHISRYDDVTRQSAEISPWPVNTYGARPTGVKYRYTWITPLVFSPFPPHPVFLGAQMIFRSDDNGAHWTEISPDLSGAMGGASPGAGPRQDPGAETCHDPDRTTARVCGFGVVYAIEPSPVDENTIWAGTDDGYVRLTTDGGAHWKDVTPPGIPAWGRIDAISASADDAGVAYVAVDLHRIDRREPLLFRTRDAGQSWTRITDGIPGDEYTLVIRADPVKPGLLFAGTQRGVYVSFDDGASWRSIRKNMPTAQVRDLMVHHGDLIAATNGHAIWTMDDIEPLRQATAVAAGEPAHLYHPATAIRLRADENRDTPWPPETPLGENPPTGAVLDYVLASGGPVSLTIRDSDGEVVRRFSSTDVPDSLPAFRYFQKAWVGSPQRLSDEPGMHRFVWDLRQDRPDALGYEYSIAAVWGKGTPLNPQGALVLPGDYTVTLSAGGKEYTQPLTVKMDPRVDVPDADLRAQLALADSMAGALHKAVAADRAIGAALQDTTRFDRDTAGRLADLRNGNEGLRAITGVLTSLYGAVTSADNAPTQGARDVWVEYLARLERVLAKWGEEQTGVASGR